MTHTEILEMIGSIGLPYAYHHFAEGESPDPPFIVFYDSDSDNFIADNIVYGKIEELNIELYTDKKDPDLENRIETVLENLEIPWEKEESWIEEEKMYEVLYQTEI